MSNLLPGALLALSLVAATPSLGAPATDFRLSPPPSGEGQAPLLRSVVLDTESVSIANAAVEAYRAGSSPARTRADASGQTVTAELRAPFGLSNGKLFLQPFVGAGGGLGTSDVFDGLVMHASDGLIWTTKVGFYVRTTERVVWQLSYHHIETPDFDTKRSVFASRVSPNADVVGAELRFVLGR